MGAFFHLFWLNGLRILKKKILEFFFWVFQAMTIVYGRCSDTIGPFNDTKYMTIMLEKVKR